MQDKVVGYGPQGFALEVNPWQSKRSVDAVLLYRGAIVSAWANVETTLIEMAVRASHHPSYIGRREFYPKTVDRRLAYLRAVIDLPGPLNVRSRLGHAILDRFRAFEDLRNVMAHAHMRLLPGWGATFELFEPVSGEEVRYRSERFTEDRLRALAVRITRFSRAVRYLASRLDAERLLPPLSAAE